MTHGSFQRPEIAAEYARAKLFAAGADLAWMVEAAALRGQEYVLDLGTAAGHTALALAPNARLTVGLDPAAAMLRQAQQLAAGRTLGPLAWVQAVSDPLPFAAGAFDLVTCRLAAHHFPDLPGALYEIERVLRPGGRLLVVDTIAPEDPTLDAFINEVEVVRDPTHAHNYRLSEWAASCQKLGLHYALLRQWRLPLDFADWTKRIGATPAAITRLEALFDQASPEAVAAFAITLAPTRAFQLHVALFVATKPPL